MRRALFVLASAMLVVAAGTAVAGADGRSEPTTGVTHHEVTPRGAVLGAGARGTPANLSRDTRVLGLRWTGDPEAAFTVETRDTTGRWHRAENVAKPDGGADPGSADARRADAVLRGAHVSDPVSVADAERVRVRVERGTVRDVEVVSVSSTSGSPGPTGSPGGGSVPPALALSGVAVGALAFPGRRGLAVLLVVIVGASGALFAMDVVHPSDAGAIPGQPRIVSRVEWGADESLRLTACPEGPGYAIPRIAVVHHTDGTNSYSQGDSPAIVRGLYTYFVRTRGYCDMGYNFLVDRFGTIYEGRYGGITQGVIGAHATLFNTGTFGVALMGSHVSLTPSGASIDSLVSLLAWKMSLHRMNPYQPVPRLGTFVNPIIGHRDAGAVSGDGTSCPGQAAYDLLPSIRSRVNPQVDYGTPIGNLESVVHLPGSLQVRGWAIDPETTAPITVHAYLDGTWAGAFTANVNRPDVGGVYWWLGSGHGFNLSLPVGFETHQQVCVYAINVGTGAQNPLLGCAAPPVTPVGNLETAARSPGAVRLKGWAIDPDTADPIAVHVYVDGTWGGAFTADGNRPDVGAKFAGYGNAHGFDVVLPLAAGDHRICVYGINVGGAAPNSQIGCKTLSGTPQGTLESARRRPRSVRLKGWAIDPDTANPIAVHVYVDGAWGGAFTANADRPDIGARFAGYGNAHGFSVSVPIARGDHQICVYAINFGPAAPNPLLGCRRVSGTPKGNFESAARSSNSVQLTGWAFDPDTANPITVHVYVDGAWGGAYTASANRPDVAAAFPGYGASHGFDMTVGVSPGTHRICVFAINVGPPAPNPQLGCRTA